MIFLGFTLVLVGVAVVVIASAVSGGLEGVGGVILIGPIPIVFGAGSNSNLLIALSVLVTIISLAVFLVLNRRTKDMV